jgi:hypothetical protein
MKNLHRFAKKEGLKINARFEEPKEEGPKMEHVDDESHGERESEDMEHESRETPEEEDAEHKCEECGMKDCKCDTKSQTKHYFKSLEKK